MEGFISPKNFLQNYLVLVPPNFNPNPNLV